MTIRQSPQIQLYFCVPTSIPKIAFVGGVKVHSRAPSFHRIPRAMTHSAMAKGGGDIKRRRSTRVIFTKTPAATKQREPNTKKSPTTNTSTPSLQWRAATSAPSIYKPAWCCSKHFESNSPTKNKENVSTTETNGRPRNGGRV